MEAWKTLDFPISEKVHDLFRISSGIGLCRSKFFCIMNFSEFINMIGGLNNIIKKNPGTIWFLCNELL
jgi:hypothetical protein